MELETKLTSAEEDARSSTKGVPTQMSCNEDFLPRPPASAVLRGHRGAVLVSGAH